MSMLRHHLGITLIDRCFTLSPFLSSELLLLKKQCVDLLPYNLLDHIVEEIYGGVILQEIELITKRNWPNWRLDLA